MGKKDFFKYSVKNDNLWIKSNTCNYQANQQDCYDPPDPTYKNSEFPFTIGDKIENNKIISHWLIAGQMVLMEQLWVMNAVG
jgi:hypothetical protein